ncbi:MAG: sensor domain-containing diguanylate cyclase [Nitrospirae bacterium]|nr:sensor domain-containing diguanylate cyclase [Nitrospirota bacterium]
MKDKIRTPEEPVKDLLKLRRKVAMLEALIEEKSLSEERYRSLVESTEDSIYLVDRDYRYLFINKKHLSRLGLLKNNFHGRTFDEFHSEEDTRDFTEKVDKVFKTGRSIQYEHKSRMDDKYFLLTLSPVRGKHKNIISVTVVSKDITRLKDLEENLRTLSLTDDLTDLYNRRGFFALAEHQLKVADRQKKGLFLLYADFDNLKKINDKFGHNEGSRALVETAKILKKHFRKSDIMARMGGDEFAIIPVVSTGERPDKIADRLKKYLELYYSKKNFGYKLSISIGIAYYDPDKPCSIHELLSRADKLMYEQKKLKSK